ncbi:30S ribosomal protein S8e [Candidatus Woesearchaeota archaeon]|nr:30S ribosomal protein S8e [Candidatus Woesearchaeota archaeon]
MAKSQLRPRRKQTGARYVDYRKKRLNELGREPAHTHLAKKRIMKIRARSSITKMKLLSTDTANLFDPKDKKFYQAKIKTILENPANRHFIRRNIMTKGAIIDTDKGRARITSRPGQDGMVNAVLIS